VSAIRIGIFGGAFDPPHMGHLLAATYFLACDTKARLIVVPSLRHPFGKQMAPFAVRARWCQTLAALLGPRASVSTVEEKIAGTGRSLLVVRALRSKYPRAAFSLIVGADAYAGRDKWFEIAALEQEAEFFVLGRGAQSGAHLAMPEVSSSELRARLAQGLSCEGLVPERILQQVIRSQLYAAGASPRPTTRRAPRRRARPTATLGDAAPRSSRRRAPPGQ
jgi:nicotinate-nucleotide adenylyltransferase